MDYKKYSLENLENWLHDAMSTGEATPQEIYAVIRGVVEENYYTYKDQTAKAYELLALLNGNGKGHIKAFDDCVDKVLSCDQSDSSLECKKSWTSFWEDSMPPWGHSDLEALSNHFPHPDQPVYTEEELNAMCEKAASEDKVVKWQLPVQVDELTDECFVEFPDDLLERAGLKEGDVVEWIDRKDGSFELRKVHGTK